MERFFDLYNKKLFPDTVAYRKAMEILHAYFREQESRNSDAWAWSNISTVDIEYTLITVRSLQHPELKLGHPWQSVLRIILHDSIQLLVQQGSMFKNTEDVYQFLSDSLLGTYAERKAKLLAHAVAEIIERHTRAYAPPPVSK
jgi:hypothetical protein